MVYSVFGEISYSVFGEISLGKSPDVFGEISLPEAGPSKDSVLKERAREGGSSVHGCLAHKKTSPP